MLWKKKILFHNDRLEFEMLNGNQTAYIWRISCRMMEKNPWSTSFLLSEYLFSNIENQMS